MSKVENNITENKITIDTYIPLNVCACQWEKFMNNVFQVLSKYLEYIKYETRNLNSEEACELNLHENSIVID